MSMVKYHKSIGFEPRAMKEIFESLQRVSQLRYTQHAKLETIKDRYAVIPPVKLQYIRPENIFEYTRENGRIIKFVARLTHLDNNLDFCYSISTEGIVITVWANEKNDDHRTLNESSYRRVRHEQLAY